MNKVYFYIILIIFVSSISNVTFAQEISGAYNEQPYERQIVVQDILNRLTVWRQPDGTPVYHQNCRTLEHGCERQVQQYVEYIYNIAENQNIDPVLLVSVAWHESRFNAFAESAVGAVGIFQLLRRGAWSRGITFVHNRQHRMQCRNELGSCQYPVMRRAIYWLTESIRHCGSVRNGLRMYNSGRCDGPRRYPGTIMRLYREIKENIHTSQQHIVRYQNDSMCYDNILFLTQRYINNVIFGRRYDVNQPCSVGYSYCLSCIRANLGE